MEQAAAIQDPVADPVITQAGAAAQLVAGDFIRLLAAQRFDGLKGQFAAQIRFRALVPSGIREASGADGAVGLLRDWFGDADTIRLAGSAVGTVGDRLSVRYCLQVHEAGCWYVVEQGAFVNVAGGRITAVDLVCSGFRPLPGPDGHDGDREEGAAPEAARPAARPAAEHALDAAGATCATLTPLIAAALKPLERGDVLVVRSDDPAATDGIASWTRLTGNELAGMERLAGGVVVFRIRKR